MNFRTASIWARVMCAVSAILALLYPWPAALLALVVLGTGTWLRLAYRRQRRAAVHTLPAAPDLPADVASDAGQCRRLDGNRPDRVVHRSLLFAGAAPALVGTVFIAYTMAYGHAPLGQLPYAAGLGLPLASFEVLVATVYLSTLVDWYYILPRVSGLVTEPPCRSSPNREWVSVARNWYLHRWFASMFTIVCIAVFLWSVTYYPLIYFMRNVNPTLQLAASLAGPLVVFVVAGFRGDLHQVVQYQQNPIIALGQIVKVYGESFEPPSLADRIRQASPPSRQPLYYVVDVSVQGMKLKGVRSVTTYGRQPFYPNKEDKIINPKDASDQQPFEGCAESCSGVNWYCDNNARLDRYR
jgi:hypothetical protein